MLLGGYVPEFAQSSTQKWKAWINNKVCWNENVYRNNLSSWHAFSWFPTMVLSVEFKNKIPPPSVKYAARTVGIYSLGRFITPPQGRHDAYVEVWTAPSGIREGEEVDGWRDDQFCLAIATQMALTLPMEVNEKKGNPKL